MSTTSLERDCIETGVRINDAVAGNRLGAPCERAGAAAFGTSSMKSDMVIGVLVAWYAPAPSGRGALPAHAHCITSSHVRSTVSDAVQSGSRRAPGGRAYRRRLPSFNWPAAPTLVREQSSSRDCITASFAPNWWRSR